MSVVAHIAGLRFMTTRCVAPYGVYLVALSVAVMLTGCSLLSFESPAKPLSTRDLNTRILVYEYADRFAADVTAAADAIAKSEADAAVRLSALRWKIAAVAANQQAATQIAPQIALLDSWAFAAQMRDFLGTDEGGKLFGSQQRQAVAVAESLLTEAQRVGARVTPPKELPMYTEFIDRYVREHPLSDLQFARASIIERWAQSNGADVRLVDSLGTIPEAISDLGSRVRLYGDRGPDLAFWQGELALRNSGYNSDSLQSALDRFDAKLDRLMSITAAAPQAVRDSVHEMRDAAGDIATRFDESLRMMMTSLHDERALLAANVSDQRAAMMQSLNEQRIAAAKDANEFARNAVNAAGQEIRRMVRLVMIGALVFVVVLLGLPFGAGYWLGRARARVVADSAV